MPVGEITLGPSPKFPPGTNVSAYRLTTFSSYPLMPAGAPQGAAQDATTVGADGTWTFVNGLIYGQQFVTYGLVDDEHRYEAFSIGLEPNDPLPGPTGPRGPIGLTGAQGVQGIQGIQGVKGDKGDKGDAGVQGPPNIGAGVPQHVRVPFTGDVVPGLTTPLGGAQPLQMSTGFFDEPDPDDSIYGFGLGAQDGYDVVIFEEPGIYLVTLNALGTQPFAVLSLLDLGYSINFPCPAIGGGLIIGSGSGIFRNPSFLMVAGVPLGEQTCDATVTANIVRLGDDWT